MTTISREGWLEAYSQERTPSGMGGRLFTVKRGGIYNGDKVDLDIRRMSETIATVVKKCTGANHNDITTFTTKKFKPPALHEDFSMQNCELLNRPFGVDPYTAAYQDFMLGLADSMADGFRQIGYKIDRNIELQAWQILQTGQLSLPGSDGTAAYELDFSPKAAHFPTVATAWSDSANAKPLDDLEALAKVIRADGKINPNMLIMGSKSLSDFLAANQVKERADIRRYELVQINPRFDDSGATFYGTCQVGAYSFQIWTYPETYDAPVTGDTTEFLDDNSVVMLSDRTRLDKAFARVPPPFVTDPRLEQFVPSRISSADQGFDVLPHAYVSQDGREVVGELQSCPLLIPVQLDGFGCLTTTV